MKKTFLLIPIIGACLYVSLSSNASGYGANRTGSHGGTVGCGGGCHGNSSTAGITIGIELDSAGVPVTHYKAGMSYTLKMTGTNTTTNALPKFGAQLTVVSGSGGTSVNRGATFSSLPTGMSTYTSSTITVLEHDTRLLATTGGGATGSTYVVSVGWTAPAAGTGTVTAYGVVNAVNNSPASEDAGDKWNSGNTAFPEWPAAVSAVENVTANDVNVYPNPVTNVLNIGGYNGDVTVYDMNGKIIAQETAVSSINTSSWVAGVYYVVMNNNGVAVTKAVVKQ